MKNIKSTTQRLPKPLIVFVTLLLIISVIETLIMFLLPLVMPDPHGCLQNFADSLLLATFSAPFIWTFIAKPLRTVAMTEITRTQATLEHIVDAVINFDGEGIIESLNPAAERMFGYAPGEIVGQNITRILPGVEADSGVSPFDVNATEPAKGFRVGP